MSFVAHRGRDLLIRGNTIDHSLKRVWLGEQVPINTSQHTVEGEAIKKEIIGGLGLICIPYDMHTNKKSILLLHIRCARLIMCLCLSLEDLLSSNYLPASTCWCGTCNSC